ncbi:HAD family hydrolase [Spirillospora albida]|uniref:HAD family hydrolase n=1 Tax=Spirillospora albida TaxID=58123 RepID=UPI0004BF88FE|nr:HAD family hydrolase [Spirillospora albida]
MPSAVLFDLDGTLLDHDTACSEAIVASFPDADPEWLVHRWAELSEEAVDRYLAGELDFTGQRRARIVPLARELGLGTWDATRADAWIADYVRRYEDAWRPYPDAFGTLRTLAASGVRLGVITNGQAAQQRAKIARLGLTELLPYVLASSEAAAAKPSAAIFHTACDALGLAPETVAYVGDRLATDARAAASAGLTGIWLDRPGTGPDPRDVPRITTLRALPPVLARR